MSHKNAKIKSLIAAEKGKDRDAHYLSFFECFNRGFYYEAHDVLEILWLPCRKNHNGNFYKGLIQVAGAFVHFQKHRLRPAASLLRLARENLRHYTDFHEGIAIAEILNLIEIWLQRLASAKANNPFENHAPPILTRPISLTNPKDCFDDRSFSK